MEPDTSRYDAGRGLWLKGDGHGGFRPVPGQESGVKVYGEQRGCALADIRLAFGQRLGPAREIHAGSGYWSQDSAVQVMGTPEPPTGVRVRWPGGKTTTGGIPAGAREIVVDLSGEVRVLL